MGSENAQQQTSVFKLLLHLAVYRLSLPTRGLETLEALQFGPHQGWKPILLPVWVLPLFSSPVWESVFSQDDLKKEVWMVFKRNLTLPCHHHCKWCIPVAEGTNLWSHTHLMKTQDIRSTGLVGFVMMGFVFLQSLPENKGQYCVSFLQSPFSWFLISYGGLHKCLRIRSNHTHS